MRQFNWLMLFAVIGFTLGAFMVAWDTRGSETVTPPDPYVVWCERLWIGPKNPDHVVVMVWSDGEVWAARTDHLQTWNPITTVRDE